MTANELLAKITRPTEAITVPQLGEVKLRALTAAEWDLHEAASVRREPGKEAEYISDSATLIRYAVVDDAGANVFTDEHLPSLALFPAEVSRPLTKAIFKLCGIGGDLGKS